ncbi:DUF2066 domain-containing protein [Mesorhizobium sp. ES1-1]|uniref:DUF2066 domain-containing protein n=1 Tax=Mesorhizobium sp. ES1-1 TaxID=2876629 RepID=UPI001CCE2B17|nr:DUF2066 domain-containing protein [Mesorhizobium sp. ES1-1]MBZ9678940.1 DUF2066 domain-containing protein [Mesorhizobium sp. ES1-1]
MSRFWRLAMVLVVVTGTAPRPAAAASLDDLYQSQTIVTGQGEVNRETGFKACLDAVLLRVSGDQRLLAKPEMAALRAKAGEFVAGFRYHDRMEGIPVHDEQGTHDRPHDLYCRYAPPIIDRLLISLGGKSWLAERPRLAVFLSTRQGVRHFTLDADDERGELMRQSFGNAATPLAMQVVFPRAALLSRSGLDERTVADAALAVLDAAAKEAGADKALAGSIVWNDKELGWIADWRLAMAGKTYSWQVRGVSFDEAFRVAMRGTAQILSGNL